MCNAQIVGFGKNAYHQFEALRSQFRRLDTRDLRIAAIALATNSIIITRNIKFLDEGDRSI